MALDPKLGEAMMRLMADALKGVASAQEALRSLAQMPKRPEAFYEWIRTHAPNLGDLAQSELIGEQFEEWLRMMGFVPRSRYLELLERHELLRRKLEEMEKSREKIQSTLDPSHVASELLNTLGSTIEKTLASQQQWVDLFLGNEKKTEDANEQE